MDLDEHAGGSAEASPGGKSLGGFGKNVKIAVVGLGYVGLPLAVAFARKHDVVGFDVSEGRVAALREGFDSTNEISADELAELDFAITDNAAELNGCEIFIVTVPTPIDRANRPDFDALLKACALIGPVLSKGAIVVFESTVYPGVTEEICAPVLEQASGLKAGVGFKLGYSPERINPGDKDHPIHKITKVVAGQDAQTLDQLAELYLLSGMPGISDQGTASEEQRCRDGESYSSLPSKTFLLDAIGAGSSFSFTTLQSTRRCDRRKDIVR